MLKNLSKLELTIENKAYSLLCDIDSPLPHVKEALFQFQKYVGQIEDTIKSQMDAAKAAEAPAPAVVEAPVVAPSVSEEPALS